MSFVGNAIIYIIMFCTILGALAAIRNPEKGLGAEFISGIHSIGPVFVPVAGIMASIPYLSKFITWAFHPLFVTIGADPSIAATAIVAVDMGGYQLADAVADAEEFRDQAEQHAQNAETLANALNLPTDLTGQAGMLLAVKEDETGYEPIESKGVFYGLRKDGAKLLAESGNGTFIAKDYPVWFITLPGVDFSIGPNGHLHINI